MRTPMSSPIAAAATLLALLCAMPAQSAQVDWADWTSATVGASGSAAGLFDTADGPVQLQFGGQLAFAQLGTGGNYFSQGNPPPYTSPLVDNPPTPAEMLALSNAGTRTLQFSRPVDNLFFAVVSLNGNGFRFDSDFEIVSEGRGYWGNGDLTRVVTADGRHQLNGSGEPHGVIRFTGSVSSITWQSLNNEYWYGFTVGTYGVAPPPPVPEPASLALMLLGLGGVGAIMRRRRR